MKDKNSLFHAVLRFAYIFSRRQGNKDEENETINRMGERLSLAYQLFDDLRDSTSREEITGKKVGVDIDNLVIRIGVEKANEMLINLKTKLEEDAIALNVPKLNKVVQYILSTPS